MQIKAPPTKAGKPPPNFPSTKGEFEHLTSKSDIYSERCNLSVLNETNSIPEERYDGILKAYDITVKGDVTVYRERLRAFLGLSA